MSSRRGLTTLFAIVIGAVTIFDLSSRDLWRQRIWEAAGVERFLIFLAVVAVWFAAWITFRREWMPAATAATVAVYTAFAVGVVPLVATAFFLFACFVMGSILAPRSGPVALLAGLSILIWIAGVLAHVPVNYPAAYAVILAAVLVVQPRITAECLRRLSLPRFNTSGEYATLAVALIPLLAHWLVVLKPEVSGDALSMHLVVPAYVGQHHQWSFDFHHWVWAVMPMGGVWGYTIAYLLGGEFAARLLNFGLLCAISGLIYQCAVRWVNRSTALLLVGVFASTPMVQLVTGSLFIETFYAALIFGALAAMWESRWSISALLLGSAVAVKFTALFFVAPAMVMLFAMWRSQRSAPSARGQAKEALRRSSTLLAYAVIFLAAAMVPYAYAWAKTGNPVFPFYNNVFHSRWFDPVANPDPRFSQPLTWHTPFDITFHTHLYWEGQDGSAGFQFLFLIPFVLPGVRRKWGFAEWSLIGIAFGATLLGLALKPNIRYLYPAFPLLTLAIALAMRPVLRWAGFAVMALNLAFLPSSSWFHKAFCFNPFNRNAAREYLATTAPERLLIERLNHEYPGESALFLETMNIAGLRGEAWSNGWHDREFVERITTLNTAGDVRRVFEEMQLRHFVYPTRIPVREAQVGQFLAACTRRETEIGDFVLANYDPNSRESAPEPAPAGTYDDFDPRIRYFAHWSHDPQFDGPANHSLTYSDLPNAAFQFRFRGNAITWVYTKAANRGSVHVFIDGTPRGEVDLFAPETQWQSHTRFADLAAGDHTLEVRNAGKPGRYIDLDELIVE
jgi:hypothetical protein